MLLGGTGAALTIPQNGIALAAAPPAKAGVASGIFNTARETGGCVGVALTSAVVSFGQRNGRSTSHAFTAGYADALLVAAVLTLGAALLTLTALRSRARAVIPAPRAGRVLASARIGAERGSYAPGR